MKHGYKMADEKKVLLGIADTSLRNEEDLNAGWSTNKFGGVPNWMPECLPSYHPKCGNCSLFLYLVAQIYCPLEGDEHHRTLYIFGCLSKDCKEKPGSWAVVRCQFVEENTNKNEKQKVNYNFAQESWCDDADDWGIADENEIQKVDFSFGKLTTDDHTDASKPESSKNGPESTRNEMCLKLRDGPPSFRPCYVHVVEEPRSSDFESFDYEMSLLRDYEAREGALQEDATGGKSSETYEKTAVADGDRTFHKFQKRIRFCKEQCLRYSWNGKELLLSERVKLNHPTEIIPCCTNCGSERIFEMQLMPALVSFLIPSEQSTIDEETSKGACMLGNDTSLDFGTIFIYTCSKSCDKTENGYNIPVDEFIVMQPCADAELLQNIQQ